MGGQLSSARAPRTEPGRSQATQTAPVRGSHTYFDRYDLVALLSLTAVAFVLRFFSPILPDFFLHPLQGPWITDCVSSTPINPQGDPGTLCGLAYPFNRGYADANGQLSPPNGQVFDEVYFPDDARRDVKGIQQCHPTTKDCQYSYFDPEPPLAKELIAAGEWGYGWYRATFQGARGDYNDLGFNTFGWRIAACLFGTLCIPMMYLLANRLWPNRIFAIAAATLACFDGMFFIQSRIGMIDIFPIFFILASYFLFLVHIQSRSFNASMLSLLALGTVLGIGIAAKWIVLAAWASIVFLLVLRIALRSLKVEFGPSGWPFLSSRSGERTAISSVYWPAYLSVAILALEIIPLGIYVAPWFPITRVLFMYHMFGGLIFMVLALAFVLTHVAEKVRRPRRELLVAGYLGIAALFFGYFYPNWTALPLSQPAYYLSSGTPIWGPKLWLVNCKPNLPPSQPQLFCWN